MREGVSSLNLATSVAIVLFFMRLTTDTVGRGKPHFANSHHGRNVPYPFLSIERSAMPLADISFGELLLVALEIFFFVIWIWILITILTDLFRDHEISGWAKAAWVLFLVFIPFLTALIYLIARGSGMRDRTIKAQADAKKHFDEYVREQAHASPGRRTAQADRAERKGRAQPGGVRPGEDQTAVLTGTVRLMFAIQP